MASVSCVCKGPLVAGLYSLWGLTLVFLNSFLNTDVLIPNANHVQDVPVYLLVTVTGLHVHKRKERTDYIIGSALTL